MTDSKPTFALVGIERPGNPREPYRVYASRDLPEDKLRFGIAQNEYGTATGWHIDAEMREVLIADAATWSQALGRVFEIWENHDRKQRDLEAFKQDKLSQDRELAKQEMLELEPGDGSSPFDRTPTISIKAAPRARPLVKREQ